MKTIFQDERKNFHSAKINSVTDGSLNLWSILTQLNCFFFAWAADGPMSVFSWAASGVISPFQICKWAANRTLRSNIIDFLNAKEMKTDT